MANSRRDDLIRGLLKQQENEAKLLEKATKQDVSKPKATGL